MKIIAFQHQQHYDYLLHVFETHSRQGMPAAELPLAADVYSILTSAREVQPDMGKAMVTEVGADKLVVEIPAATVADFAAANTD